MGLRMFVEPEATESKVATKADPSAPARSAIRRQRTVRYTPHTRDHPSRALNDALSRELQQRRLHRQSAHQRGSDATGERRERERGYHYFGREAEREAFRADMERHAASQRQRMDNGRALLRDALSYERPGHRMRLPLNNDEEMPDLPQISDPARASYSEIVQRPQARDEVRRLDRERRISLDELSLETREIVEREREIILGELRPETRRAIQSIRDMSPDGLSPEAQQALARTREFSLDDLPDEARRVVERELGLERSPPPRYMPTPPYSFEDSSTGDHLAHPESIPPHGAAQYTASFAPARNQDLADFHRRESQLQERMLRMQAQLPRQEANANTSTSTNTIFEEVENARRETLQSLEEADRTIAAADRALSELPPLRRMRRRSHLPSPPEQRPSTDRSRPVVDGLGDRSRSFSPDDDNWDTLLRTMTPDERVPSVNSSFTSATASASASASSSLAANSATNSYGTLATSAPSSNTSATELYATMCDDSDISSDDSNWEIQRRVEARDRDSRPIYSRRYESGDRAEQLVSQEQQNREDQEARREARVRALAALRRARQAQLQRLQADLDRLNRADPDQFFREAERYGLRSPRERL